MDYKVYKLPACKMLSSGDETHKINVATNNDLADSSEGSLIPTEDKYQNKHKRSLSDGLILESRKRRLKNQSDQIQTDVLFHYYEAKYKEFRELLPHHTSPHEIEDGYDATCKFTKGKRKKKRVRSISHNWDSPVSNKKFDKDICETPPSVKNLLQKFESTSSSSCSDKSLEDSILSNKSLNRSKKTNPASKWLKSVRMEFIQEKNDFQSDIPESRILSEPKNHNRVNNNNNFVRFLSEPNPLRNTRKSIREIPPIVRQLRMQFETSSPPLRNSYNDDSKKSKAYSQNILEFSLPKHGKTGQTVGDCQDEDDGSHKITVLQNENSEKLENIQPYQQTDSSTQTVKLESKCATNTLQETVFTSPSEIVKSGKTNWELEVVRDPGTPSVRHLAKQFEEAASISATTSASKKVDHKKNICLHGGENLNNECAECNDTASKPQNNTMKLIATATQSSGCMDGSVQSENSCQDHEENESRIGELGENILENSDVNFDKDRLCVFQTNPEVRRESDVAGLIERFSNKRIHCSSLNSEGDEDELSRSFKKSKSSSCTKNRVRNSVSLNYENCSNQEEFSLDDSDSKLKLGRRNSDIALLISKFSSLSERKSSSSSSNSSDSTLSASNEKKSSTTPVSTKSLQGKVRHLNADELKFFNEDFSSCQPFVRSQSLRLHRTESLPVGEPFVRSQSLRDRNRESTSHTEHQKLQRSPSCPTASSYTPTCSKNIPKFCRALHPDELCFFSGDFKKNYLEKGPSLSKDSNNVNGKTIYETHHDTEMYDGDNNSEDHESNFDTSILRDYDANDISFFEGNFFSENEDLNMSFYEVKENLEEEHQHSLTTCKTDLFMMDEMMIPDPSTILEKMKFKFPCAISNMGLTCMSNFLPSETVTFQEKQRSKISPLNFNTVRSSKDLPILTFTTSTPLSSLEYDKKCYSDQTNMLTAKKDLIAEFLEHEDSEFMPTSGVETGTTTVNTYTMPAIGESHELNDFQNLDESKTMLGCQHTEESIKKRHVHFEDESLFSQIKNVTEGRRLSDVGLLIEKFNNMSLKSLTNSPQLNETKWISPRYKKHDSFLWKKNLNSCGNLSFFKDDTILNREGNLSLNCSAIDNGKFRVNRRDSDVALLIEKFTNWNLKSADSTMDSFKVEHLRPHNEKFKKANHKDSHLCKFIPPFLAGSQINSDFAVNLSIDDYKSRLNRRGSDVASLVEKFSNLNSRKSHFNSPLTKDDNPVGGNTSMSKVSSVKLSCMQKADISFTHTQIQAQRKPIRKLHPDEMIFFKNPACLHTFATDKIDNSNQHDIMDGHGHISERSLSDSEIGLLSECEMDDGNPHNLYLKLNKTLNLDTEGDGSKESGCSLSKVYSEFQEGLVPSPREDKDVDDLSIFEINDTIINDASLLFVFLVKEYEQDNDTIINDASLLFDIMVKEYEQDKKYEW